MAKGYLLTEESQTWVPFEGESLQDLQTAVKGFIELFPVDMSATLYGNEEGKLNSMVPTAFWLAPNGQDIQDVFVGPLVLLGPGDDEGRDTDATPEMLEELLKYHIAVIPLEMREQVRSDIF